MLFEGKQMGKFGVILKSIQTDSGKSHQPGYPNLPNPFHQMILFPLSDQSMPAFVYLTPNAAFPDFLHLLGFLRGEE